MAQSIIFIDFVLLRWQRCAGREDTSACFWAHRLTSNLCIIGPDCNAYTGVKTQAFEDGYSQEDIFEYTKIDPWFVAQFWEMHQAESWLKTQGLADISAFDMLQAKKRGFSDSQIARFTGAHSLTLPSL